MSHAKPYWILSTLLFLTLACAALSGTPTVPAESTPTATTTKESASPTPTEIPVTHTPRPTPQPITCTDDSCLDACISRINQAVETHDMGEIGGNYAGKDVNLKLTTYKVENEILGKPVFLYVPTEFKGFQEDTAAQQLVWNYAISLLPQSERKWVSEYDIFTDGPSNTLAWVDTRDFYDRSKWTLGVDIIDAEDPVYLTYTLVHEFGHILTLNTDQIPQEEDYYGWLQNLQPASASACATFASPEGCSNKDSYINNFYRLFWQPYFEEWYKTVEEPGPATDDERIALVHQFYSSHSKDFIREYAATNIREDMAESFTYFVLEPKPENLGMVNKKLLFFYQFPQMVELRQQIIQNVCAYAQP